MHQLLQQRSTLAICTILACVLPVQGASITAKSVSFSDVSAAVSSAADGDTVVIPAGTATWTATLALTKTITLQGQTTIAGSTSHPKVSRQTIILNDIVGGKAAGGKRAGGEEAGDEVAGGKRTGGKGVGVKATGGKRTLGKGTGGKGTLNKGTLVVLQTTRGIVRITGVTFQGGGGTGIGGTIRIAPGTPDFRIDHCEFLTLPHYSIWVENERGLIDHNVAEIMKQFVEPHPGRWGGGSFGDASFSSPLSLGTDHAIFVEDNYVISRDTRHVRALVDSQAGARYVIRHNTSVNSHIITHGTESGRRNRAPRSWEIYDNVVSLDEALGLQTNAMLFRGGTGVVFGNMVTGKWDHFARLVNYRDTDFFDPWQGADGTSNFDLNDTSDYSGNGLGGGPGGLCASGTHSGSNGATTLVVSGNPWKTNQWVKYTIKNVDTGRFSVISSNTSNTISYLGGTGRIKPVMMPFNTGNHFQIRKVIQSIDHVGAGQSDLMGGGVAPTPRWLHQIIEPAYFFQNTFNGATVTSTQVHNAHNLIENQDYYVQKEAFNGTSGVGVGLRAARPATCTKGVGYWATDENKLYKATATNTWTLYYAPYTYPHPLVTRTLPSSSDSSLDKGKKR